ncbi:MAG: dihydroneopterin aldolase [Bacteroidota bacterium]|nr:dihydroneopterin aldolase [Bacteroidota bacterium]
MISLEGMKFFAYHGCFKEEATVGTHFIVDLFFEADTTKAELSDNLKDTIDYQAVYMMVKKQMEQRSNLLENVAHRILKSLTEEFPEIGDAEVKISKMNPPLGGQIGNVSITLSNFEKNIEWSSNN